MSRKHKFWLQHNQPIEMQNEKMYYETVWYIHQNPVVAGFVYEAEQWIYSSAKGYAKNELAHPDEAGKPLSVYQANFEK